MVSTRLFPLRLLWETGHRLRRSLLVKIEDCGNDVASVELVSLPGAPNDTLSLELFKCELTQSAVRHWTKAKPQLATPACLDRITISLAGPGISYQIRKQPDQFQISLLVPCDQISWPDLLQLLANVKGVTFTVESTWPDDRYVVTLNVVPGVPPSQVVQEITAQCFPEEQHPVV